MTAFLNAELAPLVATAAVMGVLTVVFCRTSALRRKRTLQFQTAGDLLRTHRRLLGGLLDDDRVPEKIKGRLLAFSEVISQRAEFLRIFDQILNDMTAGKLRNENAVFDADVAALNAIEDGLGDHLNSVVSTGTAAMLLQYAHVSEISMARLYADRRTEPSLFASAVRRSKDIRRDGDNLPTGLVGAV
jgi:hypothetical protein